jgi:TPR repeat protein
MSLNESRKSRTKRLTASRLYRRAVSNWKVGSEKALQKACRNLRAAANLGHVKAMASLGSCYDYGIGTRRDSRAAFACYLAAAFGGHSGAMYSTGVCFLVGAGTSADRSTALAWLERSAGKGSREALYALGVLFQQDPSLGRSKQSFRLLMASARKGHVAAQTEVGHRLEEGVGISRDRLRAKFWYDRAAKRGSARAREALTRLQLKPSIRS